MVLIESGLIDSRPGGIAVSGGGAPRVGWQTVETERAGKKDFSREIVHERQMERGVRT